MITFNAQQKAVAALSSKEISWLFSIVDTGATTYNYSTKTITTGVAAYTFKIEDFDGVELNRSKVEERLIAPNDINFTIINSNLTVALLVGGYITLRMLVYGLPMCATGYQWNQVGATHEYFLSLTGGGDPVIAEPYAIRLNNIDAVKGTITALNPGEYGWGLAGAFNTIYVHLLDATDPDSKSISDYVLAGYVLRTWKFKIFKALRRYTSIHVTAKDFLQEFLDEWYPNQKLIRDIFPASDSDNVGDSICVPEPYGDNVYIPLRSIYKSAINSKTGVDIAAVAGVAGVSDAYYISDGGTDLSVFKANMHVTVSGFLTNPGNNGVKLVKSSTSTRLTLDTSETLTGEVKGDSVTIIQSERFYVLGPKVVSGGNVTYSISKVRSPRETGAKSEWDSGTYTFTQTELTDAAAVVWKTFQPIIAVLQNQVTISPSVSGLWRPGDTFADMPTKLTRSDTSTKDNPADVINQVLLNRGIVAGDIDAATSFAAAHIIYDGYAQALTFKGAFWYKEKFNKVLSDLLIQCHSCLQLTDKLELYPLLKTSQMTLDASTIMEENEVGIGTFTNETYIGKVANCLDVAWQQTNEAQDKFMKVTVPVKSLKTKHDGETLEVRFVQDSQNIQRIGQLYGQRKLLKNGEVNLRSKMGVSTAIYPIALQPNDMITVADIKSSTIAAWVTINTYSSTTTNLAIYTVGQSITVSGFTDPANNGIKTVVSSMYSQANSRYEIVVSQALADGAAGDSVIFSSNRYDGTYDCLVDRMKINFDGAIDFTCLKFSDALDDWANLSPTAITVPTDDSVNYWSPSISGMNTDDDTLPLGKEYGLWGRVVDKPWLTIAPNLKDGEFTSLENAITQIIAAGVTNARLYIKNGTYLPPSATISPPNIPIEIEGQTMYGVILNSKAGSNFLYFNNYSSRLKLLNFSIVSKNVNPYSSMITMTGKAVGTPRVDIDCLKLTLAAATGEWGIVLNGGASSNEYFADVGYCEISGGAYGIISYGYGSCSLIENILATSFNKGISIGNANTTETNIIRGNKFRDTTPFSITGSGSVLIEGNIFNSGSMAIGMGVPTMVCIAKANILSAAGITVSFPAGAGGSKLTLDSNTITNSGNNALGIKGISIANFCDGVVILNNTITIVNAHATPDYNAGIYLNSDNNQVSNNTITVSGSNAPRNVGVYVDTSKTGNRGEGNVCSADIWLDNHGVNTSNIINFKGS